jgi:hypothetical protein
MGLASPSLRFFASLRFAQKDNPLRWRNGGATPQPARIDCHAESERPAAGGKCDYDNSYNVCTFVIALCSLAVLYISGFTVDLKSCH